MLDSSDESSHEIERSEISSTTPLLTTHRVEFHSKTTSSHSSRSEHDDWESEQKKLNPRNWSTGYKWLTVIHVSFIEFLVTLPNFLYAPNITDAQRDLHTDDDTLATFSLTIYILGFALGPLLFGPLSELYGRAAIYRACLVAFLAMTAACALSSNIGMLVASRFFAGCFGAAPVTIGGAVVSDLFSVSERGTAMSVYGAGLIIAAIVGPPLGGLIGSNMGWRWSFWILGIMTAVALLCTFIVLRETHHPTLQRRFDRERSDPQDEDSKQGISVLITKLKNAIRRPILLLVKSPVVFACCILIFLIIGILNVFLTESSRLFQRIYGFSSIQSGLVHLGLACGFVIASGIFAATNDRIMGRLARKHKGEHRPEFRLPVTMATMPLIAVGLLWYGWTLYFRTHWIVPFIGSGVAGIGITTVQLSVTTYIVDSFDSFSASALAAIIMARSLGGAVVALAGPPLYKHLGLGWGNSVFAFVSLICCVIPFLLYRFGSRWRAVFSTDHL